MTEPGDELFRRDDARERARRDVERHQHREPGGGFWHGVALVGSVGWPIVLLATGGALLGRHLDARWGSGVRCTLALLALGTTVGTWIAFRATRRPA